MKGMVGHLVQDTYESFGYMGQMLGPNPIDIPWDMVHANTAETAKYKGGKLWKFYEDHPEREEQFIQGMRAVEGLGGTAMALDAPFSKFDRVIDIGGSSGHFLYKVPRAHPKQKGVLFDRPIVLEKAKEMWSNGEFRDVFSEDRATLMGGSFFDKSTLPPTQGSSDVYLLRYIIHDWPRAEAVTILKNLRSVMLARDETANRSTASPS